MSKRKKEIDVREAGFYLVTGLENIVTNFVGEKSSQPAYWTGNAWIILGWDIKIKDHANYKVVGKIIC